MKKHLFTNRGFTIVELLVTIVVIGILASIILVSYSGIQQRSRDSERGSDITQLKIALEKYHADKSQYPNVCTSVTADCSVSALAQVLAPYIKSIPHDPSTVADSPTDYRYAATDSSEDTYGLKVTYESKPICFVNDNPGDVWGSDITECQ